LAAMRNIKLFVIAILLLLGWWFGDLQKTPLLATETKPQLTK
jgi:hypothetical protein